MVKIFLFLTLLCSSANAENSISIDEQKITGSFRANNNLYTGLKVDTVTDFSTGMAGASFGMYSIVRGNGDQGNWGVHDIVGVHGTAVKNGKFWATGLHCDVYDTVSGGTSICLNMEFPQTQNGTNTIGLNMQPHVGAKNLIGIQIQNPESFKYSLMAPNISQVFGQTDDAHFGMRFDSASQSLKFYRNIGQKYELMVHEIKMDYGQVK